jgi:hypothetical protein
MPEEAKTEEKGPFGLSGKWFKFFKKLPLGVLLSPGGMILAFFGLFLEVLDFLIPAGSFIIEGLLEIFYFLLFWKIAKVPLESLALPFLIERVDILGILPTTFLPWLSRLFG